VSSSLLFILPKGGGMEAYMKKLGLFLLVLSMLVSLFPQTAFAAESTAFDQDLATYLSEVSAARGFDVSVDDVNESLSAYGMTTEDFSTVDELKTFLGDPIQSDLSNLSNIYKTYDFDQTTLNQKLNEYGEDLNDYVYLYDLDTALSVFVSNESDASSLNQAMALEMLKQFDISEDEIQNLKDYYLSIQDYINSEEVSVKLEDLRTRMTEFGQALIIKEQTDDNYKPTQDEINQITSMYDELFSIIKLTPKFYLTSNGVNTPISLAELLKMDSVKDADVTMELYTSDSTLLATMVVPNEMLQSKLEEAIKDVSKISDNTTTQKGGTLPKTATNYLAETLLGLIIACAGIFMYRKVRNGNCEIYKEQA
jgi:processed acidic surface protein